MSQVVNVSKRIPSDLCQQVSRDLQKGKLVVFPTETVYGLGTSAFAFEGLQAIYELKGRSWKKPVALLVSTLDVAKPFIAELPIEAKRVARVYAPGPMTFVFETSELGRMVMAGKKTIGVRIPDHPIAMQLLKAVGIPLATTSANPSSKKPAISGEMAREYYEGRVDWLLDGGACKMQEPSTVIDFSHFPFTVIREGAVSKKDVEKIIF